MSTGSWELALWTLVFKCVGRCEDCKSTFKELGKNSVIVPHSETYHLQRGP